MLRIRRIQAGLTQEQLAELSGLSVRAISDIERGTTARPRRSSIALLEAALSQAGEDGHAPPGDGALRTAYDVPLTVPRQLPQAVPGFVGRARELNALTDLVHGTESARGTVVISAIAGAAGVGKTALAVHWAHQVAEGFPDGQLYVNLRGYDPGQPVPAGDALAWFLRALGVAGQDIPPEADERAALYRSLLAGRRMLVLLDNAGSAEQVRSLLPGAPACGVVVTSRESLAGLVARDGAVRLDLDLLPLDDAVALLRALIGRRADAQPGVAEAMAELCCRLPLALRVAAELAAARSAMPLADLVGELADQRLRLDFLDAGGDPRTAVREVFSWSYRHLDTDAARLFRLLGLHPGPDFDRYAAAALADVTIEHAGRLLDGLARVHMAQKAVPGRYGLHDLLRAYARELSEAQDAGEERQAALTRLFDHYLYAASAAMAALFPAEIHRRPQLPPSAVPVSPMADSSAALAWLDSQRANLMTAVAHTAGCGWSGHATRLATVLSRYLDTGGHYLEAIAVHDHARRAARLDGDRAAEATALTCLGLVYFRQGRYQQATSHLQQALSLHRRAGDRAGQARALGNLGLVEFQEGRCEQAAGYFQRSLSLHRQTGDRTGEAGMLCNLGYARQRQGYLQQATEYLSRALAMSRETGDLAAQARALGHLGLVTLRQGRYPQAAGRFREALALSRDTGARSGTAHNLANLGLVDLQQGHHQQAAGYYRQALELFREFGDRSGEAEALNGIGAAFLAAGKPDDARSHHETALSLARRIGDLDEKARAHDGLGQACHAVGDIGQARRHWEQALALYAKLGVPEAEQVRAKLGGR